MKIELETAKTRYGHNISLIKGDIISESVKKHGAYDFQCLEMISKILIRYSNVTTIDIGANIGNHTLLFSKLSDRVYSFEPVPEIFNILKKNIDQNNIKNVICINSGLSNESIDSTICVQTNGNIGQSSLEYDFTDGIREKIHLEKGDDTLSQLGIDRIDFIKIDVEGHEKKVIEGIKESLLKFRPIVYMEWEHHKAEDILWSSTIFKEYFPNYTIFAIKNKFDRSIWKNKFFGLRRRRILKKMGAINYMGLIDFTAYRNDTSDIILIPIEKIENIPSELFLK